MLQKLKGIVLHYFRYSDSGIIVKIYTEERGLQGYFYRTGKGKNKKTNLIQPLSLVELVSFSKEHKSLAQLREVKLLEPYTNIPLNMVKTSIAIFIAEFLHKSLKEEEANPALFNYLYTSLLFLDKTENPTNFHLIFLAKLTRYLGFAPDLTINSDLYWFSLEEGVFLQKHKSGNLIVNERESANLMAIFGANFDDNQNLNLSNNERRKALRNLINYCQFQLEGLGEINSHIVLEAVLD